MGCMFICLVMAGLGGLSRVVGSLAIVYGLV